jgi:glyoxalase family protein
MPHPILGLHHVTATVDQAQADLDFCVGTLGLRLVKRTVNFDNHHVYHFYYGDERGTPGTIWTTFPYHGRNVRTGTKGIGQVTATALSVPAGSLDYWEARVRERGRGAALQDTSGRFGEEAIRVTDPSGLVIEIVTARHDARRGWDGSGIDHTAAVRGLHSVTLTVRAAPPTIQFLTDVLGFRTVADEERRTRLAVASDAPGTWLDIVEAPDAPPAVNGLGTVHHVALAIASDDEQLRLRDELLARDVNVTEVRDRQYFRSIYFREPGGVLIEVATVRPGFDVDEPLPCLGQDLKLPPWEEPHRAEIESGLPEIRVPGKG